MPAITTNDLKTGITLELDNGLFQVVEFQHVKPGKGGAFVRTKLRNVRTGSVLEREEFRHHSYVSDVAVIHVIGEGVSGYATATARLIEVITGQADG